MSECNVAASAREFKRRMRSEPAPTPWTPRGCPSGLVSAQSTPRPQASGAVGSRPCARRRIAIWPACHARWLIAPSTFRYSRSSNPVGAGIEQRGIAREHGGADRRVGFGEPRERGGPSRRIRRRDGREVLGVPDLGVVAREPARDHALPRVEVQRERPDRVRTRDGRGRRLRGREVAQGREHGGTVPGVAVEHLASRRSTASLCVIVASVTTGRCCSTKGETPGAISLHAGRSTETRQLHLGKPDPSFIDLTRRRQFHAAARPSNGYRRTRPVGTATTCGP